MRIVFDIDGTFTDFEKFVLKNAPKYVEKKLGLLPTNLKGYDVDQVFDIENQMVKKGVSKEEAALISKKTMDSFWVKYYLKYSLLTPYRTGVRRIINTLYEAGHEIILASSRKKTCDDNLIGKMVRATTIFQATLNGVKRDKFLLFPDDEAKMETIKLLNPDIVVDDKPELIQEFSKFTSVICINSNYNFYHNFQSSVFRVNGFDDKLSEVIECIDSKKQNVCEKNMTKENACSTISIKNNKIVPSEKINNQYISNTIQQHPAVKRNKVISIENETLGVVRVAFFEINSNWVVTPELENEILNFCNNNVLEKSLLKNLVLVNVATKDLNMNNGMAIEDVDFCKSNEKILVLERNNGGNKYEK